MRSSSIALCLFLLFLIPVSSRAADLVIGPFLQDLRTDGVTVVWETDEPSAGVLEYGETVEYGSGSASGTSKTHHEVRLVGLMPATAFHYRVNVDGQPAGKAGSFVTAPTDTTPFTFLSYGDNRSDHDAHALVVSRMLQHQAPFVINTGDMVSDGPDEEHWLKFFEIEADLVIDTPLFYTIGNHEEEDHEAPEPFIRLLVPPKAAEDHPTYYSFDYSNSHFIVLDGHAEVEAGVNCIFRINAFEECFDEDQMAWLKADLQAANADETVMHVIVITHVGPYSSKKGRSGSAQMRALLPLFAENKVSLIISGHDHYYEHGLTNNGINYVITGGGGAPLYETKGTVGATAYPHKIMVSTSVHNFINVYVAGPQIEVTAYEADGTEIEEFEIGPKPDCVLAQDCEPFETGSCEGEWQCNPNFKCQWVCDQAKSCITPDECGDPPGDRCEGQWECLDNTCQWMCDTEPDCVSDDDCMGRAGLSECQDGYFACMDGMCEWTCPPVGEVDEKAPEDGGMVEDAAEPDVEAISQDLGGGNVGGGTCSLGNGTGSAGVLVILLLAGLVMRLTFRPGSPSYTGRR